MKQVYFDRPFITCITTGSSKMVQMRKCPNTYHSYLVGFYGDCWIFGFNFRNRLISEIILTLDQSSLKRWHPQTFSYDSWPWTVGKTEKVLLDLNDSECFSNSTCINATRNISYKDQIIDSKLNLSSTLCIASFPPSVTLLSTFLSFVIPGIIIICSNTGYICCLTY